MFEVIYSHYSVAMIRVSSISLSININFVSVIELKMDIIDWSLLVDIDNIFATCRIPNTVVTFEREIYLKGR